MASKGQNYLQGPILQTMIATGLSMVPATLAMSLFNIVDTFFIGRLGIDMLAAMGFCLPIVGVVTCVFNGMSTAVMTLLSHALGRRDDREAARIILHGLMLILMLSLVIGGGGALCIRTICEAWIETPAVLDAACQYLVVWLCGAFTISLGMGTNKLVLALGHPRASAGWMLAGLASNVVFDIVLIFGLGPIPAMGMIGAALATVLAQALTPAGCLWIIHKRLRIFTREALDMRLWKRDVVDILRFSVPTILGIAIMPLTGIIATSLAAHFGDRVVAAMACIARIEVLAFVIPMSVGMALNPMLAQNYGAHQLERIDQIRRISQAFAGIFLLVAAALMSIFAEPLVRIFIDDPDAIDIAVTGMRIVAWGFAGQEIHRFGCFVYNGCNRPGKSALLKVIKIAGFSLPLMMLSLVFDDMNWLFYGRLISEILGSLLAWYLARRLVRLIMSGKET